MEITDDRDLVSFSFLYMIAMDEEREGRMSNRPEGYSQVSYNSNPQAVVIVSLKDSNNESCQRADSLVSLGIRSAKGNLQTIHHVNSLNAFAPKAAALFMANVSDGK